MPDRASAATHKNGDFGAISIGTVSPTTRGQEERQQKVGLVGKTIALHVLHAFLYIARLRLENT